jgi:SAM-dependent methyltransferase
MAQLLDEKSGGVTLNSSDSAAKAMLPEKRQFWENEWLGSRRSTDFVRFIESDLSGKSVADIGCGDMKYSELPEKAASFVGVDLSIMALAKAKKNHPLADLVCADAEHLPFRESSFDIAVAVQAASLFDENVESMLRQVAAVVKKGGEVQFDINHVEGGVAFSKFEKEAEHGKVFENDDGIKVRCVTEGDLPALLASSGLSLKGARPIMQCEVYELSCDGDEVPEDKVKVSMLVVAANALRK